MGAPEEPLARVLAGLARGLRSSLRARLRRERAAGGGALLELQAEVTRVLVAQDEREFADEWAQTLVYLLLVARWLASPGDPAEMCAGPCWGADELPLPSAVERREPTLRARLEAAVAPALPSPGCELL